MNTNTTTSATNNRQTESELLAGISKSPVLEKVVEKNQELQNFITNFKNLVMTKNELAFRACVGSDQPFSEKFVNFFKWIWKNICYYVGSVNLKKGVNFADQFLTKHPDIRKKILPSSKLDNKDELNNATESGDKAEANNETALLDSNARFVLGLLDDGIKVPLSSIKGLVELISGGIPKVNVNDITPNAQDMEQAKTAIKDGLNDAGIDISNVKFNEEHRTIEINGKVFIA